MPTLVMQVDFQSFSPATFMTDEMIYWYFVTIQMHSKNICATEAPQAGLCKYLVTFLVKPSVMQLVNWSR